MISPGLAKPIYCYARKSINKVTSKVYGICTTSLRSCIIEPLHSLSIHMHKNSIKDNLCTSNKDILSSSIWILSQKVVYIGERIRIVSGYKRGAVFLKTEEFDFFNGKRTIDTRLLLKNKK